MPWQFLPRHRRNLADVVAVAAGGRHSIALTRDGEVVMWGNTTLGQITNRPAAVTNIAAIAAGIWHSLALRADGTVFAWGDLFNGTNSVPAGLSNITAIAAGPRHCLALRNDGTVAAWGFDYSFLGNFLPTNVPPDLTNVVAISAGMEHNEALLRDGTVRVWGRTNNPAMANGWADLTNLVAVSSGWHYGLALSNNATLARWGQDSGAEGIDALVALSAGASHALVIRTNSGSPVIRRNPRSVEAPVGTSTNISVEATSSLPLRFQWRKDGADLAGQTNAALSFPNLQDADDGLYQVRVATDARTNFSLAARVTAVHPPVITNQTPELNIYRAQYATSESLRVAVHSKGTDRLSYQWFHDGQPFFFATSSSLGLSYNSTNNEGTYHVIVRNIAGSATSAVWTVKIRLQGEAIGWGDNSSGQLNANRQETSFVAVSAGGLYSVALRENGTVCAWGDNNVGQTNVPAGLTNVVAISASSGHSLALRENGMVTAWGWNYYGQINVPPSATNVVGIAAGSYHSLALRMNGTVVAWGDGIAGVTNVPADLTNAMQIAAGHDVSFALLSNGTVRAWGNAAPTIPASLSNVVQIAAGYDHGLALRHDGTVTGLGADSGWGETTAPAGLSNVLQVAAGHQFSVALRNDYTVVAWGRYDDGQTNVPPNLSNVKQVSAGGFHALALAYSPVLNYPVTAAQDLLLIYNTNSASSIAMKDYYLAHRPKVAQANVLGIGCATGEHMLTTDFTNQVWLPVLGWLDQNPTKRPNYLLLSYDVPSRFTITLETTNPPPLLPGLDGTSIAYQLRSHFPWRQPFVTHLNMQTTNDCIAYINKLAAFGSNLPLNRVIIRGGTTGYSNRTFVVDNYSSAGPSTELTNVPAALLTFGIETNDIYYSEYPTQVRNATNVAAYVTRGKYAGWPGSWPTNTAGDGQPYIKFHGDSTWHIMQSVESFNGLWNALEWWNQSSFLMWFSSGAFGGTNYVNTPVGAASHVSEPQTWGVNNTITYFGLWHSGKNFGISAWVSSPNPGKHQATGDPWVAK